MSSVFWLGWRGVLGLAAPSKTTQNLLRTGQCVLNLPSVDLVGAVNRLARTTGSDPIPAGKVQKGYRTVQDKFTLAGLTPTPAETVAAPRVLECPVQLEAVVEAVHGIAEENEAIRGRLMNIEVRIQRVHIEESIMLDGHPNRVDPNKWRPLIMSFQHFYGLGARVHDSTLAEIPEALYRSPDVDRARTVEPQLSL
jgi:flavin reductase (DIM6/NTAB) family NADH-FMN oxidoreductase RutF